jgi:hypothetical protein
MSIEAMKQALEALESKYLVGCGAWRVQQDQAIAALRQAIEQAEKQKHAEQLAEKGWQYFECPACGSEGAKAFPKQEKQEPVGWFTQARNFVSLHEFTKEEAKLYGWNALYLHPPQRTEPDDIASILACRDMLDAQPVPPRTWVGLEGAEFGWFCHTDFLNARKYTKEQRKKICCQLLSEAQSWDIKQYQLMMHDSTKLKENT